MKLKIDIDDSHAGEVAELERVNEQGGAVFIRAFDGEPVPVESVREMRAYEDRSHDRTSAREYRYVASGGHFTVSSVERAVDGHCQAGLLRSWKRNHDDLRGAALRKHPLYTVTLADGLTIDLGGVWELRALVAGLASARVATERQAALAAAERRAGEIEQMANTGEGDDGG